jgi:hypothetical protein
MGGRVNIEMKSQANFNLTKKRERKKYRLAVEDGWRRLRDAAQEGTNNVISKKASIHEHVVDLIASYHCHCCCWLVADKISPSLSLNKTGQNGLLIAT